MSETVLAAVTEEELDVLVSIAIRRAEVLDNSDSPGAIDAWREVMVYEERLSEMTAASEVPGGVARVGAVTAALAAGDRLRATELAQKYLSDQSLPTERRQAIERALDEHRKELAKGSPALSKNGRLDELDDWHSLGAIRDYYKINKEQARSTFAVSVIAMSAGLLVLVFGIILFYLYGSSGLGMSSITIISSAFLNIIGGAYFYLYKESISRLNDFHDKLVKLQATMLAATLCDQIADDSDRDRIKEHLIAEIIRQTVPPGGPDLAVKREISDLK